MPLITNCISLSFLAQVTGWFGSNFLSLGKNFSTNGYISRKHNTLALLGFQSLYWILSVSLGKVNNRHRPLYSSLVGAYFSRSFSTLTTSSTALSTLPFVLVLMVPCRVASDFIQSNSTYLCLEGRKKIFFIKKWITIFKSCFF